MELLLATEPLLDRRRPAQAAVRRPSKAWLHEAPVDVPDDDLLSRQTRRQNPRYHIGNKKADKHDNKTSYYINNNTNACAF
jgi:hypothetical protein